MLNVVFPPVGVQVQLALELEPRPLAAALLAQLNVTSRCAAPCEMPLAHDASGQTKRRACRTRVVPVPWTPPRLRVALDRALPVTTQSPRAPRRRIPRRPDRRPSQPVHRALGRRHSDPT